MRRIWLDSYPPGVPADIAPLEHASLCELFERSCDRFRSRPALSCMGATLDFGELERRARDCAAYLQTEAQLRRGERIALMLPNLLQYPVTLFGALLAGLVVVNINPLYTAAELEQQLTDSGARAIIVLESFAHTLERVLGTSPLRHVITTQPGDLLPAPRRWAVNLGARYVKRMVPPWRIDGAVSLRRALARGRRRALERAPVGPDDVAFLQYTGGTTGSPKGAMLTHGNMLANLAQTQAWGRTTLREAREIVVTALPLYHVFALTANLLLFLALGGHNLLIPDPRNLSAMLKELRRLRFTAMTGVNTLYRALLDAPGFTRVCTANRGALKLAVAGGMAVQQEVAERWQRATGVPLIEGYGLTEASPNVCANPFAAREFSGKLGLPLPSTEVAILDEHGAELPPGEQGEISVRGPQVTRGYWNRERENAEAFTPQGWLKTGDIGRMDARGYLEFVDRKKDVIVVSGFKAYPTEIEEVALRCPGVLDAGAIGVPDARSGEAVALFAVRSDPALGAEALRRHCAQYLTGYKLPAHVEFRGALPKNPLGKVLRRR
ncbi:MAG: AMP-binding protein, partial [Sphingomonadaceae bacterium]